MTNGIEITTAGPIGGITVQIPPVNAIASEHYIALGEGLAEVAKNRDVRVLILASGIPGVFCAGADIREVERIVMSPDSALDVRRQALARETYQALVDFPLPTIAVINGLALGAGAVLAACCDIRVASTAARLGLSEVNVARCGGGRHLMRHLPQGVVREMYFTGEPLDAATAFRHGLFNRVVDVGSEMAEAEQLAASIASKSPLAVTLAKQALNGAEGLPLDEGYAVEQEYTLRLGRSADAREAARAFLDKRAPVWTGG